MCAKSVSFLLLLLGLHTHPFVCLIVESCSDPLGCQVLQCLHHITFLYLDFPDASGSMGIRGLIIKNARHLVAILVVEVCQD